MNMQNDIIQRFYAALPGIRQWIEEYLNNHAEQARSVSTLGFERLPTCFSQDLLERTKVVMVPLVHFPPIDRFNLPEMEFIQQMPLAGITFKDTFFLQQDQTSESLYFHELVHIVQWATLGVDKFLLAYGIGLLECGYKKSPLEQMAYTLQDSFNEGILSQELGSFIETRTNEIWNEVAPIFQTEDSMENPSK